METVTLPMWRMLRRVGCHGHKTTFKQQCDRKDQELTEKGTNERIIEETLLEPKYNSDDCGVVSVCLSFVCSQPLHCSYCEEKTEDYFKINILFMLVKKIPQNIFERVMMLT